MVWRFAACLSRRFGVPAFQNISVRITTRCIGFISGQAHLRILDVSEIKNRSTVPPSHPFIERLIGTIRRECLDRLFFWTASDLAQKLTAFQDYYNRYRN
jgi:Integrase core domain